MAFKNLCLLTINAYLGFLILENNYDLPPFETCEYCISLFSSWLIELLEYNKYFYTTTM